MAGAVSRTDADPGSRDETAASLLASRQVVERHQDAVASTARPPSPEGDTPPGSQGSGSASREPPPWSPQTAAGPAAPRSTVVSQMGADAKPRPGLQEGEIRIFIHHVPGRDEDAALAQQLADHLERQGFAVADIRPVDFSIGKPSVRYFFAGDRSASERLVEELGKFFDSGVSGVPDRASDFTHFEPKPRPGNVEVWLAGP